MKMLVIAAVLTAAIGSEASAGGLINVGGNSKSLISVSPSVNLLNGNKTNVLTGILSGNSILSDSNLLSKNGGLLGLGILSGNNNDNSRGKTKRGCGCR